MQADGTSRQGGVSRKLRGCGAEARSPESRQLLWAGFVPLVLPDPLAMVDCEGCRKRPCVSCTRYSPAVCSPARASSPVPRLQLLALWPGPIAWLLGSCTATHLLHLPLSFLFRKRDAHTAHHQGENWVLGAAGPTHASRGFSGS